MAELDPDALLSATQVSEYAGVSIQAVCNWVAKGYLPPATDQQGREIRVKGRRRYRLLDAAKAENSTRLNQRGRRAVA